LIFRALFLLFLYDEDEWADVIGVGDKEEGTFIQFPPPDFMR